VKVVVPALGALRSKGRPDGNRGVYAAANHLWLQSAEFLLRRSEFPPEPPKDWRLDATLACRCADCRELQTFVRNPAEQVHRFRVRKERRQHLHREIEQHRLEMTHVTERKGSPQTLVCTKDRRGYRQRCAQYRDDVAALTSLAERTDEADAACALLLERIASARTNYSNWSEG
jgi:hypothetical protein